MMACVAERIIVAQEDDMLRDVMEGNAAHIEPPAVFAREMQAAGFTPAGNWDATDEVIPSSTLIKRLWRWVELVAPIASRLKLVPQSYVTHGGAAAGQLHLFQKRVLSYRVMLATKWRLPPQDECAACATTPGIRQGSRGDDRHARIE
jgi:hypothetical protein